MLSLGFPDMQAITYHTIDVRHFHQLIRKDTEQLASLLSRTVLFKIDFTGILVDGICETVGCAG